MKIMKKSPDPFLYEGTKDLGLLLIHGFTGSPSEMRTLGNYLNGNGYTTYGPQLAGHGSTPEEMAKTRKEDWWNSVIEGYQYLIDKGYKQVVAIGLSMGGILSLKLAIEKELKAVIPMAAPIFVHDKRIALSRWIKYIKAYEVKKISKEDHIAQYLDSYDRTPIACAESLYKLMKEVKRELSKITIPIQIMQGKKDETVMHESANYIYSHVHSKIKELKWYEKSTHIMTLDREKEKVYEDILHFLDRIGSN